MSRNTFYAFTLAPDNNKHPDQQRSSGTVFQPAAGLHGGVGTIERVREFGGRFFTQAL